MDLTAISLYDHHAHALFREAIWRQAPLEPYFSEATDPELLARFGRDTLSFRRGIRDLAAFYGCAPTVDAVLDARGRWDYRDLVQRMFADAAHRILADRRRPLGRRAAEHRGLRGHGSRRAGAAHRPP